MDNATAKETATKIVDGNPRLDSLDPLGRKWLISDIANELQSAHFRGGHEVMASWTESITQQ